MSQRPAQVPSRALRLDGRGLFEQDAEAAPAFVTPGIRKSERAIRIDLAGDGPRADFDHADRLPIARADGDEDRAASRAGKNPIIGE